MKKSRCRTLLAALLAVFAFGALASASASATLPEFKVPGAKYPVTFTGASGAVHLEVRGIGSYTCTSSSITGEIVGPKEIAKVVAKFVGPSGCSGFCNQSGHESFWETKELKGRIDYLSKSTEGNRVGLLLEAVAEPIATCTTIGGPGTKLQGSIIGELGPTRAETKSYELHYEKIEAKQNWLHFEGEKVMHNLKVKYPSLETPAEMGLAVHENMKLTMAQKVELRA